MRSRPNISIIFMTMVCFVLACPAAETPAPNDPNRYLNAVRAFADNVLKYGRDTYGPTEGLHISNVIQKNIT
jgi:hypothetical protein